MSTRQRALIGCTGFVGGNLKQQTSFNDYYHSRNIENICGRRFHQVVCAGVPSVKWKANQAPQEDRANIHYLIRNLEKVKVDEFILISTVDVYPKPVGVDEDTVIDKTDLHPYGLHRLELEEFVKSQFEAIVIRLPGLFGHGLKKNVIYDLLHNHCLDQLHPDGVFQYYDLTFLWHDIEKVQEDGLRIVNFATEPIATRDLAAECFHTKIETVVSASASTYNMRSKYSSFWGRKDGYIYGRAEVMQRLKQFIEISRGGRA